MTEMSRTGWAQGDRIAKNTQGGSWWLEAIVEASEYVV